MALAVAAVTMLLSSGPGTRLGLWSWPIGLDLLEWATYAALAAGAGALVQLALPRLRRRPAMLFVALGLALVVAVPPIALLWQAYRLPFIHDVTTDSADPPAFVALLSERSKAPNGSVYGGPKVAAEQGRGYPDIRALVLPSPPEAVLPRALAAARAMDWQIVASDAAAGRIEATATTLWFGFKDDVIVRIRAEAAGSRVDVRSVSRVGDSDIGANAKRIREFLARLA